MFFFRRHWTDSCLEQHLPTSCFFLSLLRLFSERLSESGLDHGTPSRLSVGAGSCGWNTPTPCTTWTEGTPSFTESSCSGVDLGQSQDEMVVVVEKDVCRWFVFCLFVLFSLSSFLTWSFLFPLSHGRLPLHSLLQPPCTHELSYLIPALPIVNMSI